MGQFARMLPAHGWDVTVVTARHPKRGAVDHLKLVETWSPSTAVTPRGQAAPRHGLKGSLRRALRTLAYSVVFPDREVLWVASAVRAARKLMTEVRHDAVLATHGPASNLLVGRALAKSFGLPLVVDFRDLWSTLPIAVFPTDIHRAAARRFERAMVSAASRVIAVAPGMAANLAHTHALDVSDTVSITNGFDPADASRVHDARTGETRPFRLVYTGSVSSRYNLDSFWRAVRGLVDSGAVSPSSFRIEFVGNLSLADVRKHGVEEIVDISGFVPHDQVFDAFARADALLVIETPGYYAEFSYAAKVFDYLLTGKPVVALVEQAGNTYRLLSEAGVGHFADQRREDSIRRAILDVLALKGAPPKRVDVDAEPLRSFNRQHLTARLAAVLDNVIETEPMGRWT